MNVLHLLSHLDYHGSTKESALLARHVTGSDVDIVCLGRDGPAGATFRQAGIVPEMLDWTRAFDPTPLWRLRGLLRERTPDFIHVWDFKTLRTLALVARPTLTRTIMSLSTPWKRRLHRLDRWLLTRVGRTVARSRVEANAWIRLGASAEKMSVIAPGVEVGATIAEAASSTKFLSMGPLTASKGHAQAIYALDILSQVDPTLTLDLTGEGPYRNRLQEIQACRDGQTQIRFLGHVPSLTPHIKEARVVWAPSLGSGCTHAVLEAMAAGRPVVASNWPHLCEIVEEGVSGHLIPAGDQAALARRTWQMLQEPDRVESMGAAARERVKAHFPAERFVEQCASLYGM